MLGFLLTTYYIDNALHTLHIQYIEHITLYVKYVQGITQCTSHFPLIMVLHLYPIFSTIQLKAIPVHIRLYTVNPFFLPLPSSSLWLPFYHCFGDFAFFHSSEMPLPRQRYCFYQTVFSTSIICLIVKR